MREAGVISGVSVSHKDACVETIEAACAPDQQIGVETLLAQEGVKEAFVLQTCNRAEAYVVTATPELGRRVLADYLADVPEEAITERTHEASLRHLMRVAAGLESLVIGEDQILGQLRTAYLDARGVGALGRLLDDGIAKAIHVGERARTETEINEGTVSLASAATSLAAREMDLTNATALVIGAGEMGSLAATSLADTVSRLYVANRTLPRAQAIVDVIEAEATAISLADVPAVVPDVDLVVTATGSPTPILDGNTLSKAGELLVIDLAQPRDVAKRVEGLDNVTLWDLDRLESITDEAHEQRKEAAERVAEMIDREFEHLLTQYKRKRADRVIAAMYESADRLKAHELATAFSQLEANGDLNEDQRAVVESLADSLVGQLLSAPTRSLRDAAEEDDWTTINTALQLFDPDFGSEPPAFVKALSEADRPNSAATSAEDD
ncbi:glutamyl-tRNA reductase [Haladaptatus sp. GCM10025707]|uniref:glutamyl-tRNA reductase n=1 Tax=unclassified Haladaptatus TaxID=2622732 RepID=UPI0023E82F21|nr:MULTISPECIES: glutamyl-tRNA reductase [unclassified Haladaptatus]